MDISLVLFDQVTGTELYAAFILLQAVRALLMNRCNMLGEAVRAMELPPTVSFRTGVTRLLSNGSLSAAAVFMAVSVMLVAEVFLAVLATDSRFLIRVRRLRRRLHRKVGL